jgi:hypothetical protein
VQLRLHLSVLLPILDDCCKNWSIELEAKWLELGNRCSCNVVDLVQLLLIIHCPRGSSDPAELLGGDDPSCCSTAWVTTLLDCIPRFLIEPVVVLLKNE